MAPEGLFFLKKRIIFTFLAFTVCLKLLSFPLSLNKFIICLTGMSMSFSIPPLFRRREKKASESKCYPTLASMSSPRISSSTTSYRSCNSNSTLIMPPFEELEDNDFYLYFRSNHESQFKRSCVVCIPSSRQLNGVSLNRYMISMRLRSTSPDCKE